jgi:acetyltransferase
MTIRNLDRLLQPRSVALVGASDQAGSIGALIGRNLREGGFGGRIMLVNPRHAEIGGEPCYPDVAHLALCRKLGFTEHPDPDEPDARIARLPLRPGGGGTAEPPPRARPRR